MTGRNNETFTAAAPALPVRLRIGEVAAAADLSVETIRYYERLGLIREAARTASGYRQFEPAVVRRLRFIRRAKELGFSLEEIRELLELRADPEASASDVQELARANLAEIEDKLADLTRLRDALLAVSCTCDGRGPMTECPILDALDGTSEEKRPGAGAADPSTTQS